MSQEDLSADEQLLGIRLRETCKSLLRDFRDSIKLEAKLIPEPASGFRRVQLNVHVAPECFGAVAHSVTGEFPPIEQLEQASPPEVRLQCTIPTVLRASCSLPAHYPQTFQICVVEDAALSDSPVGADDNETKEHEPESEQASRRKRKITLLLSGGGFRATLFHLGVMRYLRESQKLKDVVEVFSVSGGSILAAHLALNWGDYTGTENQFERAASELVRFTKLGLRERIIRQSLLFWLIAVALVVATFSAFQFFFGYSTRTYLLTLAIAFIVLLLAIYLDRFFRPVKALARGYRALLGTKELRHIDPIAPQFHFLATNLTTGNIACFANTGIYPNIPEREAKKNLLFIPTANCKLINCVAASSAFPPLFSPYELNPKQLKVDNNQLDETQFLTDGGVYDNLGVRACKLLTENRGEVLVSDAERKFDKSSGASYRWLVSRASRATDVLMHRVNELEFELLESIKATFDLGKTFASVRFARLQIDFEGKSSTNSATLSPDLHRRVRRIRTDLDAFSDLDIQLLYCKGLISAKHAFDEPADLGPGITLDSNGIPTGVSPSRWLPINGLLTKSTDEIDSQLDTSESPNWKKQLLDVRSLHCWFGAFLLLIVLLLNPIAINFARSFTVEPTKLQSIKLTPLEGDFPPEFRMLMPYFLLEAEPVTPEGKKVQFVFLESNSLGEASGFFCPAPFTFTLSASERLNVFYDSAFLLYSPGESLAALNPVRGAASAYEVTAGNRDCKLLLLLGLAEERDSKEPISISDFTFTIGE